MRYYDDLWNQNQDALVNGLRKDTVKQGSGEWYTLLKKGDDILEQRNAYNKGMMGMLDGEKAVTAQESAATQTGGGTRSVSLDAKDEAVYKRQTKQLKLDERRQTTKLEINSIILKTLNKTAAKTFFAADN